MWTATLRRARHTFLGRQLTLAPWAAIAAVICAVASATAVAQEGVAPPPGKEQGSDGANKDAKAQAAAKGQEPQFQVKSKGGEPLKFVTLVIASKDNSLVTLQTDENGTADWSKVQADGPYLMMAAAPGYSAATTRIARKGLTKLVMQPTRAGGGSVVIPTSGTIPGLTASITFLSDPRKGLAMSAAHCRVNGVGKMPVPVRVGTVMAIQDQTGNGLRVKLVAMLGTTALLEYAK